MQFSKAPGSGLRPVPSPSSSASSSFQDRFSSNPFDSNAPNGSGTGHPFFSPSSFQQHLNLNDPGLASDRSTIGVVAPGKPYPSLERRSFHAVSSAGEISSTGSSDADAFMTGSGASTPIVGPVGSGIRQPSPIARSPSGAFGGGGGVGAIGDGRRLTPSPSPSPEKRQAQESGSLGLVSSDDAPHSNPNSRPSSFILDVLPSRSPRLSTSPSSFDAFSPPSSALDDNVGQGLVHSSLFHSPSPSKPSAANGLTVSRSPSPSGNAADPLNRRLDNLENGLRDLSGVVYGELRSMKDQLASLKNLILSGGATDSTNFNNSNNNEGARIGNGAFGLESPMLTVRSPSPHQSPQQALPPPGTLRTSSSQTSLAFLNLPNSPVSSLEDSAKDDQIKALTLQMAALSQTVTHLMNGGGGIGGNVSSPLTSPHLGAHNNPSNNPMRQHSLPPMALGGLGLSSPGLNGGSPNLVSSLESWKREGGPAGLGVSTPRSPLVRPSSANSLNRNSSIGNRFGGGGVGGGGGGGGGSGEDERKRSGLSYGAMGQGSYESGPGSSNWGDSSASGMTSPLIGGPAPGGGTPNAPGSLGSKWEALGVGTDLFRAIAKYGLGPPTKIQAKAIPCVLRAQDIVAQAPSIQERIQSYVVPAIQMLHTANATDPNASGKGIQVLIITATVDQAAQAQRLAVGLGGNLGIRTSLCVGSSSNPADLQNDLNTMRQSSPHLLVGTPQKLLDLLSLRSLNIGDLKLLIIDECDQLIARNLSEYAANLVRLLPPSSAGGIPAPASPSLSRSPLMGGGSNTPSLRSLPGAFDTPNFTSSPRFPSSPAMSSHQGPPQGFQDLGRQTVILSCTVPQDVLNFASSLQLKEPVRVLVRREGGDNSSPSVRGLRQYYLYIAIGAPNGSKNGGAAAATAARREVTNSREWKLEALADLCEDYAFESCVIFCSSVDAVEAVSYKIGTRSIEALALHQDMGQAARHSIMSKFRAPVSRTGSKRALVVYDALCRTLTDLHQIPLVINYDLPRSVEDYIHRVSCATASGYSKPGTAINIVTPGADVDMLRGIESFYRCKIAELPASVAGL